MERFKNYLGPALITLGALLTAFKLVESTAFSDADIPPGVSVSATIAAITLFLAGYLTTAHQALQTLRESTNQINSLSRIVEKLDRKYEEDKKINNLRSEEFDEQGVHVVALRQTLLHLVEKRINELVEYFLRVGRGEGQLDERLSDMSVVNQMLVAIAERLPSDTVWCGISKLTSPEPRSNSFDSFQNRIEKQIKKGNLFVNRIYVYNDHANYQANIKRMQSESDDGINIRYFVEGEIENAPSRDVSLLFTPVVDGNSKSNDVDRLVLLPEESELAGNQKEILRALSTVLEFAVDRNCQLTGVTIKRGREMREEFERFDYYWKRATAFAK